MYWTRLLVVALHIVFVDSFPTKKIPPLETKNLSLKNAKIVSKCFGDKQTFVPKVLYFKVLLLKAMGMNFNKFVSKDVDFWWWILPPLFNRNSSPLEMNFVPIRVPLEMSFISNNRISMRKFVPKCTLCRRNSPLKISLVNFNLYKSAFWDKICLQIYTFWDEIHPWRC